MSQAVTLKTASNLQTRIFGKRLARFTAGEREVLSRSIYLEETGPALGVRGSIMAICGLILLFIIWASLTTFDEVAPARGTILPIGFVQPVQHLEGGIVASVPVSEGQRVAQGDVIIRMDDTTARSEYDALRVREASLSLQIERLRAFALDREPDFSDMEEAYPQLVADQRDIYRTQVEARDAQLEVLDQRIASRIEETRGLESHRAMLDKQIFLIREELDMRKTLLEKGLTNKVIYLDTERRLNEIEGEMARTDADLAGARAAVAESQGARLEIEERLRSDALDLMGRLSNEHAEIAERLTDLADRLARTEVRAPVAGLVAGLRVTGPGAVLEPGALVAEIVPDESEILAEARIDPRDIGNVTVGQPVLVKVDSYDFARFGAVKGKVRLISATSFEDAEGRPYFRALIGMDQAYVGKDPTRNRITPGMTLMADIRTGKKSLMAYLWRPVEQSMHGAFSER